MKQSRKHLAAPFVFATAALGLLGLHCSSDGGATNGTGGVTTFGGAGGGAGVAQGGAASGAPAGGVATGGSIAGAGPAGSAGVGVGGVGIGGAAGGAAGGGAGGGAGIGGASGGAAGAGGASGGVTFAQVRDLLATSCKGAKCHNPESDQMDWITADGLYMRLTSPIPQGIPHCVGNTPIVAGNAAGSLLVQAINNKPTCNKVGGGMEMIGKMPDNCPADRPCLTADQIKLITDWVTAGSPM